MTAPNDVLHIVDLPDSLFETPAWSSPAQVAMCAFMRGYRSAIASGLPHNQALTVAGAKCWTSLWEGLMRTMDKTTATKCRAILEGAGVLAPITPQAKVKP